MTNTISTKELEDKAYFESRMAAGFTSHGCFTNIKSKLLDGDISPLYVGWFYYKHLASLVSAGNNALILKLLAIGTNYPGSFTDICEKLSVIKEVLYEYEMIGRNKPEINMIAFLRSDGKVTKYDTHDCLLLKTRLLKSIDDLAMATKQTFNWIEFPDQFPIVLNMAIPDRVCYTAHGPETKIVQMDQKRPQKEPSLKRRVQ